MIIADTREPRSMIEQLKSLSLEVVVSELRSGDYVIIGRDNLSFGCERKVLGDLLSSLTDGRLYEQLRRLSEGYDLPALVVEGIMVPGEDELLKTRGFTSRWKYDSVQGILFNLRLKGVMVISTSSEYGTALTLRTIHKQLLEGEGKHQLKRRKLFSFSPEPSEQLQVLCGINLINEELASRLLERFGNPLSILKASEEELAMVKGIGKVKARHIKEIGEGA